MAAVLNICLIIILVLMIILMYSFTFETKVSNFIKSSIGLGESKKEQNNPEIEHDEMFVDTQYNRPSRPNTLPDVWITSPFEYKNYQSTDDYERYFVDPTGSDHVEVLRSKLDIAPQARIPDHELQTE